MANPSQVDELSSLEAIYGGLEDVILQIPVPGESTQPGVRLEANVNVELSEPITMYAQPIDSTISQLPPKPMLRRSLSGNRYKGSRSLQKLPPLQLSIFLPSSYLEEGACESASPHFELSALWLSRGHLSQLCQQMDHLWNENLGEPILFVWLEWLRTETLSFLGLLNDQIICLSEKFAFVEDDRARGDDSDPADMLSALMNWDSDKEQEIAQLHPSRSCDNCCGPVAGHLVNKSMLCCGHALCVDCTLIVEQIQTAESVPHCPVRACQTVLTTPINSHNYVQGDLGDGLAWVLGTPLKDDLVFCPFCESIAKDTPVAFDIMARSPEVVAGKAHECKCYTCHLNFCGTCRSPCHPGEKCIDAKDRSVRMLHRRPPLPKHIFANIEVYCLDEEVCEEENAKIIKEDCADFDTFRKKFLSLHERSLVEALSARNVELRPAPLGESVQNAFMHSLRGGIGKHGVVPQVRPAWHGTNADNHASIFARGLLIPGIGNDLTIVNGAVHGRGIYTANLNAAWLSLGFCSGNSILVCAVLQLGSVTYPGDAMVVFNPSHVIPLFEAFHSSSCGRSYGVNMTPAARRHIANATNSAGAATKKASKKAALPTSQSETCKRKPDLNIVDCTDS
jgi:hypothetical protein